MSLKTQAYEVATRAEADVRLLIEQAARAGQYQEIADLAALAQGLSELRLRLGDISLDSDLPIDSHLGSRPRSENNSAERSPQPSRGKRAQAKRPSATFSPPPSAQDGNYPRFLRDQNKLVKVGWSEREATTYEHRSPIEVIKVVVQKIEKLTRKSDTFRMEDVLPLHLDGNEVPSYQAYMALAWLRNLDLVDRSNKNSYVIKSKDSLSTTVDQYWKSLTTVASARKEMARD